MVRYGMVWYGYGMYKMERYGWYGMVCIKWNGMVLYGMIWNGMIWHGMVILYMVSHRTGFAVGLAQRLVLRTRPRTPPHQKE